MDKIELEEKQDTPIRVNTETSAGAEPEDEESRKRKSEPEEKRDTPIRVNTETSAGAEPEDEESRKKNIEPEEDPDALLLVNPETSAEAEPEDEKSRRKRILKEIGGFALYIAFAIVAALFINSFILLNATIPSSSMASTILKGDRLYGFRLAYLFSEPKRGDIVIFKYPDNEKVNYIKRIIGLPGETLEIRDGKVYINGSDTPLDEPYLNEEPFARSWGPYEIPEDSYFMMGDNRNNSKDSRYWTNTFVKRKKILAKAVFRYWRKPKLF